MKKLSIFLILLFAFLKLSASVYPIDTPKFSASLIISDHKRLSSVVFPTERLMLWLTINHPDSSSVNQDSLTAKMVAVYPDNLKSSFAANYTDGLESLQNLKQQIKLYRLDTLKKLVKSAKTDTLKALLYSEIADRYLNQDTTSDKKKQLSYQNEALNYTMKALHQYSSYNDTTGLRMSFDKLAKIYFSEKKYTQAKWFILQSNSLARIKKDVPNIITSLLTLSAIKSEIKDYKLAMNDLNEALQLSVTHHYQKMELDILKDYALLYSRLRNYPKEELMLKKRDSLEESIHKKEEARLLARVDSVQKKKLDSLSKKKVYSSNTKKLYKNNSSRRMASL
jgi:hypothetical protein